MHPNSAFRQMPQDEVLAFVRARGFGVLSVNGPEGPIASHVPFVMSQDRGYLEMHLVRSTPLARSLADPQPALLAVSGPDGYISPDWYGLDHQVPTWNYLAAHLRGRLRALPAEELRGQLERLSDRFESALAPKPVWRIDKMPGDLLDRMMRSILPCRFDIAAVEATAKFGQNKPEPARLAAADAVAEAGIGQDTATLAALMRGA